MSPRRDASPGRKGAGERRVRIHPACAHHPRPPSGDDHPALWRARLLRLDPDGWRELAAGHALPPPTAMAMDASGSLCIAGGLIHGERQRGCRARWDGEALILVDDGFDSLVLRLALAPSAQGEDVVVSGHVARTGGTPYRRIARCRGGSWEALGAGLAVAAGAPQREGERLLAAASSDAAVVGSRLVLGQWQEGLWTELATPQQGFPETGQTPPTTAAMARALSRTPACALARAVERLSHHERRSFPAGAARRRHLGKRAPGID